MEATHTQSVEVHKVGVESIEGSTRFDTAIAAVEKAFPSGATTVVTIGTAFGVNQFLEYGADSATVLNRERIGNTLIRSIYVMKMRGSKIANSIRVLDISDEGMAVSSLSPYP